MTEHEDFEGLAAGYALHALEPEDEQLLAAHLLACASCARLVADTAALGAAFAGLITPDPTPPPPAGLRARILAAAAAEPRQPDPETKPETVPEPAAVTARPASGAGPTGGRPVPRDAGAPRRSPRRLRRSRLLVGVVAAIIGIGVAVPVTLAVSGNDKPQGSNSALAQALLQSGAREVTLHSKDSSSTAKAVMAGRKVVLVASGLTPNNKARSTYVLWAADNNGAQTPIATFDVSGGAPVLVATSDMPAPASDITLIAVSFEKGRKAPAKPGDIVLSGSAA